MATPLKHLKLVLVGLERQGCTIKKTHAGFMIQCPDGSAVTVHGTESDYRAMQNTRSRIRRAGLTWPLDRTA